MQVTEEENPNSSTMHRNQYETYDKPVGSHEDEAVIIEELKRLVKLAAPLVTVNVLLFSLQLISLVFVGHLGELQLSGASMAISFASVTGFSLLTGMAGALETFCGQAYGAQQHQLLGIYMQRAMLILVIISIPISCIWINTTNILVLFGQDEEISVKAGEYSRIMIPSIFAFALLQCEVRFLQAQKRVLPLMLASGITTLLHGFYCWILVFKSPLGFRGAALSIVISYWTNFFLLAIYIKLSPSCIISWTGFSREAFNNIWDFLRLSIPSTIMSCLEIWSFEMMVLLSGRLPNPKLETSVLSISFNICCFIFMLPLGLSGAISTRVSNELGASRPKKAQMVARIAICVVLVEGVSISTILVLGRKLWAHLYSSDKEVVRHVEKMLFLLAGSHTLEGFQCVLSGIARGCGWQKIGAIINLGAYYFIGLPSGIVLAFIYHIGGKGLWMGIIVALFAQGTLLAIVFLRTDWEKEAKKASHRVFGPTIAT